MIPNARLREVESSGVTDSGIFGISLKDSAHVMTILRDTLYSDKILAVLREYGSNAWDAHQEAGKGDLPIQVTLPTLLAPTLSIRDWGPGLSPEDVFQVFTQYGASTKRSSNSTVGMLGIGSKSGFAYSDSFTIVSCHEGLRSTYVAVIDASEAGIINLLHQEPCEETGVEIKIAIHAQDIDEFTEKAKSLYRYYEPRPVINVDLPELEATRLVHGKLYEDTDEGWSAIMGCVPYRINLHQLGSTIAPFLQRIAGALYFQMGEVEISASREELKYSSKTKEALVRKFETLVDEYVQEALAKIEQDTLTQWEKRIRFQILERMYLPLPKNGSTSDGIQFETLMGDQVIVPAPPWSFTVKQDKHIARAIRVDEDTRLLIRDDRRPLRGYNLGHRDYVIHRNRGASLDSVEAELRVLINVMAINGVQVVKTSQLTWMEPTFHRGKRPNKKHHVRSFRMNSDSHFSSVRSSNWEIESRVPQPDDVYVILDSFQSIGFDIFSRYREDRSLLKVFNRHMPAVYGYKTTEKKPLEPNPIFGVHYPDWQKQVYRELVQLPRVGKLLNRWQWAHTGSGGVSYRWNSSRDEEVLIDIKALGNQHQIAEFVITQERALVLVKKLNRRLRNALGDLDKHLYKSTKTAPQLFLENIYRTYPLLEIEDLCVLWGPHRKKWLDYIKLVDHSNWLLSGACQGAP